MEISEAVNPYSIKIFTHYKLCIATATHNFKWVKITHICVIWNLSFANPN